MDARRRPHTLMIVENLPVPFDRRVWQEARTLRQTGYEVTVICPRGRGHDSAEEELEGIRILRHSLPLEASGGMGFVLEYGAALFHEMRLAWKVWRRHRFDVIHVANPPDLLFLVALPFKLFGVKFLFDHHDLTPELYFEKFGKRNLGYHLMRWTERLTFLFADAVISTNISYKQIATGRGGKKPEEIFIVRSGPDTSRMQPTEPDPAIRARAGVIIGYLGIMGSQDGIDVLLEAARILVHDIGRKDVHFMLVGDGPELPAAREMARGYDLDAHVTFTGYLRGDALYRTLSSIDIGICPDPCNEYTTRCTMNKIMEYMAFGKPMVQFDLVEGRFSAQESSLYAEPGDVRSLADKLELLIADPALRREMGEAGRLRLERDLSWANEVPKLLAAYAHLLPPARRPLAAAAQVQREGR